MALSKKFPAIAIRKSGVFQAILARPKKEGLQIVFGARRFRASLLAGRETIPALVREMTDAEVLEAQLVENLQRRDVHPMEEAEGYKRLLSLAEPTYTVEQIAAKVGKTSAYVTTRLKLTDLCDEVTSAFYKNQIGVGHALLLAKLPTEQQQAGLKACFKEMYTQGEDKAHILLPVRNLQFWIDSNVLLEMSEAPFNPRDAQLVPAAGSCVACPKRTGRNKLLFGDDLGKECDRCTDPACYQGKVTAHIAKTIAAKPELVQISTAFGVQREGSTVLPRNKYMAIRDDRPKTKDESNGLSSRSASTPPRPSSPKAATSAPSTRFVPMLLAPFIIPSRLSRVTQTLKRSRTRNEGSKPSRTPLAFASSVPSGRLSQFVC